MKRLLLGIAAVGFLLLGDPSAPWGWSLAPAAALLAAALWPHPRPAGLAAAHEPGAPAARRGALPARSPTGAR